MSLALDKLLDGLILHGGTQILVRGDDYCSMWIKAYEARNAGNKETTLKLVRKATAGFVGTADLPPADFIPEMMEIYPVRISFTFVQKTKYFLKSISLRPHRMQY